MMFDLWAALVAVGALYSLGCWIGAGLARRYRRRDTGGLGGLVPRRSRVARSRRSPWFL